MSEFSDTVEYMTTRGDTPATIEPGVVYAFHCGDSIHVVDGRQYLDAPVRKQGTVTAHDAESFAAIVNQHAGPDAETVVWADEDSLSAVAVLNGPSSAVPGHSDHRVQLRLRPTEAWMAWNKLSGEFMNQQQLAEFIEDHAPDMLEPTAAHMVEVAQSFQAHVGVDFEKSELLSTGERAFTYKETQTARAGQKGQLLVPDTFRIRLQPFIGSAAYQVGARFRYRLRDGNLALSYKLDRPEDVVQLAYADVLDGITDKLTNDTVQVLRGRP